jgi:hypothetical protein
MFADDPDRLRNAADYLDLHVLKLGARLLSAEDDEAD